MASSLGKVEAEVTLKTTAFDAGMKKVAESTTAAARATEAAAKRAAAAQETAAKYAADAETEQGKRILAARQQQMQASRDYQALQRSMQRGYLDETTGSKAATAAIQREVAARKELAAAMALGKEAQEAHGHRFTDRMATSAVVRTLEGNQGIRPVENFLAQFPAFTAAAQTLGVAIGGAGLAGMLFEMGERGVEAFQKMREAAADTTNAFQDLHDKAIVTNDDLALENQRIQDQIDKLSGHPNNGLASALLEAKKMADALLASLQEDRKEIDALLKEHDTGMLGGVLSSLGLGPAGASQTGKDILRDQGDLTTALRRAGEERDAATAGVNDPKKLNAAMETYRQSVHGAFQKQIDAYRAEADRLRKAQAEANAAAMQSYTLSQGATGMPAMVDNSQKIGDVEGRARQLEDLQQRMELENKIYQGNVKLGQLKQDKASGEGASKAAEAQMKGFEDMLNRRKMDEQIAVTDEIAFWEAMLAAAAKYPENLRKIHEKLGALNQEFYRQLDQIAAKSVAAQKRQIAEAQREAQQMLSMMKQWEQQDERRADAVAKLAEAQQQQSDAMAEQAIRMQVLTGAMSKHDAAVALATMHAADYRAALEELDREDEADRQRTTLTDDERETRQADRDLRRVNITGEMNRTGVVDQQAIDDSTALGGAKSALEDFTAAALDSSRQMRELVATALGRANDAILGNGRHRFRQAAGEIAKSGARTLLERGEGEALKAFGIGGKDTKKPTGSAGDPIHVIIADMKKTASLTAPFRGFNGNPVPKSAQGAVDGFMNSIFGKRNSDGGDAMQSTPQSLAKLLWPDGPPGSTEVMMNQPHGIGAFFGGLLKMVSGAGGAASGGGGGGGLGFLSSLAGVLPMFADGGAITADSAAIIGERGPELFLPKTSGNIVPNNKLDSFGQTNNHTINVDARGSTDPAATEAAVHRAMGRYMGPMIKASAAYQRDQQARRPPSRQ